MLLLQGYVWDEESSEIFCFKTGMVFSVSITISILPLFPKKLGQTYLCSLKSLSLTTYNDEQLRSPLVTVGNRWFVVPNSFKLLRSWLCMCKCAMMLNIQYVFRNFKSSQKLD